VASFEIIVTVALFLGVVTTGLILVIAWAVRREDHRNTWAAEAPDPVSAITRRITGLCRRDLDAEVRAADAVMRMKRSAAAPTQM